MFSALHDDTLLALSFWVVVLWVALMFLGERLVDVANALLHRRRWAPGQADSARIAVVRSRFEVDPVASGATGTVFMKGELWTARCPDELATTLEVGDRVVVERVDGLIAQVRGKLERAV